MFSPEIALVANEDNGGIVGDIEGVQQVEDLPDVLVDADNGTHVVPQVG